MNKNNNNKVVVGIAIASFLALLFGGGFLLLNNNNQRSDILELASLYAENNEYAEALAILNILSSKDKNSTEIIELIANYKELQKQYQDSLIVDKLKSDEDSFLLELKKVIKEVEQTLFSDNLSSAELFINKLLNIDPTNKRISELVQDVDNQKNEDKQKEVVINNLVSEIELAFKKNQLNQAEMLRQNLFDYDLDDPNRDAIDKKLLELRIEEQVIKKKVEDLVKSIKTALDENNLEEMDKLQKELKDELSKIEPDSDILDTKFSEFDEDTVPQLNSKADKLLEDVNLLFPEDRIDQIRKENEKILNDLLNNTNSDSIKQQIEDLKEIYSLLDKSEKALAENNLIKAEEYLKEALKLDINNVKANDLKNKIENIKKALDLVTQAERALSENNINKAQNLLEQAMEVAPDNPLVKELEDKIANNKNILDLLKNANNALEHNDVDKADELTQEALILDPNNDMAKALKEEIDKIKNSNEDQADVEDLADEALDQNVKPLETDEVVLDSDSADLKDMEELKDIEELKAKANEYEAQSNYKKELDVLSEILEQEPTAEYFVKAGIASYKITLYEQAVGYFKQAIEFDPVYPDVFYPMALTYEKLGDPVNREEMLNVGLKIRPDHAATNYELGRFYTSEGRYLESLELFLKAENIKSSSIKYKMGVALAYYNLERYQDSIGIYVGINSSNNNISEVHYNLCLARTKIGDYQSALIDISKAIDIKPENQSYLYTKGEVLEALGQTENAAKFYLEALKIDYRYYKPMLNLGNIYDKLGRYSDSVALLERSLELAPDDENVKFSLGTAYLHNKEYSKSITLLKEVSDNDKDSKQKLYNLSLAYTEISDTKAAEEGFRKVIEMDNTFLDAYFYLGQLLYTKGDIEEARTFLNKVLELDPDYIHKEEILVLL